MLERIFANWKSSTAGAVLAVFLGFVLFSPEYFPAWLIDLAKYISVGGAAALGISSFDRPSKGSKF